MPPCREGKTGSAVVTVLQPVASVVMAGALNAKVGDAYPYTVTARLADGTVVTRLTTWSIQETAKGLMTPRPAE